MQLGETWSWEHTGGSRKRLDHLLFSTGHWTHGRASQALDIDIINSVRDHVALRVLTTLHHSAPVGRVCRERRCTGEEIRQDGESFWASVPFDLQSGRPCGSVVETFREKCASWVKTLPPRVPLSPKQPYVSAMTLRWLGQLRDWRSQLRYVNKLRCNAARRLVLARSTFFDLRQQPLPIGTSMVGHRRLLSV